jgi:hypothetical protein
VSIYLFSTGSYLSYLSPMEGIEIRKRTGRDPWTKVGTVGTVGENNGRSATMDRTEVGTKVGTGGGVLPRVRASWPREAIELLTERVAIMLADTGGSDEGEVETWAEAAVRAYWAVLRGGLDPERARVERLGEEPWRVGGEG